MSKLFTATELLERMRNNDNRMTKDPYLLLLREKREVVVDKDYGGKPCWVEHVTGECISKETKEELVKELRGYYEDDNWEPSSRDVSKIYVDKYEYTVNVFLTDKGYQEHMEVNGHNIPDHDTYGIHAFRNKEIESIFDIIKRMAEIEKENS